jgi:hypothetical protein
VHEPCYAESESSTSEMSHHIQNQYIALQQIPLLVHGEVLWHSLAMLHQQHLQYHQNELIMVVHFCLVAYSVFQSQK